MKQKRKGEKRRAGESVLVSDRYTESERKGGRDAEAKEERPFFSCFSFGFSSRFPVRREACSEEATVQNLNGILHVCWGVCVFSKERERERG